MQHDREDTAQRHSLVPAALAGMMLFAMVGASGAAMAEAPMDGRIGYVLTERFLAVHETEGGRQECPHGFNLGPREQYDELFPKDGSVRTVLDTRLMLEGRIYEHLLADHPMDLTPRFPFYEAQGNVSYGLNLDGKTGPDDFKSPEGEEGVDNQLYRAIGCIPAYREGGSNRRFNNDEMQGLNYNRWMFELTGVDDLGSDAEVVVTTYRGMDELLTDASGQDYIAGGTQRVDFRHGKEFMYQVKGKIVDGVLITEPIDRIKLPLAGAFNSNPYKLFRGFRLRLALTPRSAEGLMAGYADVKLFILALNATWSTHHQSYGRIASASLYRAMHRLADGYPDPETGDNTAISMAMNVKFVQAFILHPSEGEGIVAANK